MNLQKIIIVIILIFSINISYSQDVTIHINSIEISGNYINECETIDFESNDNLTLNFWVNLVKPNSLTINESDLKIFIKRDDNTFEEVQESRIYTSSSWNGNTIDDSFNIQLQASLFEISGGVLYARYSYLSYHPQTCNFPIIKDEVPTFELSPSSTTVSCGSSSAENFSVTNVYNSPGNLVYHWSVESGWQDTNGISVSNFNTSTNSISLVPTSYPPSNVHVTPYLDGVPYEQLTSNVSLSNFNTNNQIVGNSSVCSTENYYLQNTLPNGWSVNWSLENTNIASITQNGNNATVTRNNNQSGDVTIIATFTNPCNQTVNKTLDVFVGQPLVILKGITGDKEICSNEVKTYRVNIPTCIGDVNWSVSPNLHITDEGYDYITVEENYNSTSNFGYVSVSIPDLNIYLDKVIFVGVPLNSEQLFIRKISSYNLSSYRWTKFKVHPMIDFDNIQEGLHFEWQIPNSLVRHFTDTSIIDIKPNSLGILNIGVRACNDCGCGNWKYKAFNVISPPNNSGNGSMIEPR